jgi:hypothetical protein
VISPVIDIIEDGTLKYVPAGGPMRGIFDWSLVFKWKFQQKEGPKCLPFESPAHAGGLFSINKKFFEHLGLYDTGMHVWGYENIELSLRAWMCGGKLEIHPCSRVGHIFRSKSPIKHTGENYQERNKLRTAAVWLDDYRERVMGKHPHDYGDVSEQLANRQRLGCHSFQWYLDNVFPDHPVLTHITTIGQHGDFGSLCLDTLGKEPVGSEIGVYGCHEPEGNQRFAIDASVQGQSKIISMQTEHCLLNAGGKVVLGDCELHAAFWTTNGKGQMKHIQTSQCMSIQGSKSSPNLTMGACTENSLPWQWHCEGESKPFIKGLKELSEDICIDSLSHSSGQPAGTYKCHHGGGNQAWQWLQVQGGESGLIAKDGYNLCLKPASGSSSLLARGNARQVLIEYCSHCDGSANAASSDCIWQRVSNQLRTAGRAKGTQECLRLSDKTNSDTGNFDLEVGSCEDSAKNHWDTAETAVGLCSGDTSDT